MWERPQAAKTGLRACLLYPAGFVARMTLMKLLTVLFSTLLLSPFAWSQSTSLKVGDKAPDFELQDQNGNAVRLSAFSGQKNVALAFYVLAFTGG
jgi:cytochrome oxidase Cu insertion factor (SCO1/SenC/PrrC family)